MKGSQLLNKSLYNESFEKKMPNGDTLAAIIKALAPTVADKLLSIVKDYRKIKDKDMILLVMAMNAEQQARSDIMIHEMSACVREMSKNILKIDENIDTLISRTEPR